jgi:histidine triad (HIT) family protein
MMNLLFRLANTTAGKFLVGLFFAHMSFIIPARRLRETDTLLVFRHPHPVHPFHVLLVPKKDIRTFSDLDPDDPFLADLVTITQSLVTEHHLSGYRLVVNGGEYQEFPHLHFHLISDAPASGK